MEVFLNKPTPFRQYQIGVDMQARTEVECQGLKTDRGSDMGNRVGHDRVGTAEAATETGEETQAEKVMALGPADVESLSSQETVDMGGTEGTTLARAPARLLPADVMTPHLGHHPVVEREADGTGRRLASETGVLLPHDGTAID